MLLRFLFRAFSTSYAVWKSANCEILLLEEANEVVIEIDLMRSIGADGTLMVEDLKIVPSDDLKLDEIPVDPGIAEFEFIKTPDETIER